MENKNKNNEQLWSNGDPMVILIIEIVDHSLVYHDSERQAFVYRGGVVFQGAGRNKSASQSACEFKRQAL